MHYTHVMRVCNEHIENACSILLKTTPNQSKFNSLINAAVPIVYISNNHLN